jgi:hypothetical protein
MSYSHDIRRRGDSIDFDFYRSQAIAQRGLAMRDAHALRMLAAGTMVMAGVLGFAHVIPSPSAPVPGERIAANTSSLPQIP